MKRLLIGLLLVTLLVSGCRQAVVTIPPLSAPITTTTALTWDSVASLPVGTVVELTGYCVSQEWSAHPLAIVGYELSESNNTNGKIYTILTKNPPAIGTLVIIKVRIETGGFQELNQIVKN